MKIEIVKYDGTEIFYDAISFEFRTNQVSNWIKVKLEDGTEDVIRNVCVIRTLEGNWYENITDYFHTHNTAIYLFQKRLLENGKKQ